MFGLSDSQDVPLFSQDVPPSLLAGSCPSDLFPMHLGDLDHPLSVGPSSYDSVPPSSHALWSVDLFHPADLSSPSDGSIASEFLSLDNLSTDGADFLASLSPPSAAALFPPTHQHASTSTTTAIASTDRLPSTLALGPTGLPVPTQGLLASGLALSPFSSTVTPPATTPTFSPLLDLLTPPPDVLTPGSPAALLPCTPFSSFSHPSSTTLPFAALPLAAPTYAPFSFSPQPPATLSTPPQTTLSTAALAVTHSLSPLSPLTGGLGEPTALPTPESLPWPSMCRQRPPSACPPRPSQAPRSPRRSVPPRPPTSQQLTTVVDVVAAHLCPAGHCAQGCGRLCQCRRCGADGLADVARIGRAASRGRIARISDRLGAIGTSRASVVVHGDGCMLSDGAAHADVTDADTHTDDNHDDDDDDHSVDGRGSDGVSLPRSPPCSPAEAMLAWMSRSPPGSWPGAPPASRLHLWTAATLGSLLAALVGRSLTLAGDSTAPRPVTASRSCRRLYSQPATTPLPSSATSSTTPSTPLSTTLSAAFPTTTSSAPFSSTTSATTPTTPTATSATSTTSAAATLSLAASVSPWHLMVSMVQIWVSVLSLVFAAAGEGRPSNGLPDDGSSLDLAMWTDGIIHALHTSLSAPALSTILVSPPPCLSPLTVVRAMRVLEAAGTRSIL
ncbi:uncharacterized protein BJ171DRAFT_512161, partial [Polychytrium aggregatum]|uniref:uncharacterized protein n=1 Tax=Polychytrium aggregatum TaxID=110093 RepID=UPI0022FEFA23